jgi:hypothetical protein
MLNIVIACGKRDEAFALLGLPYAYLVRTLHCKKRLAVFPSPAGCHLPNSPWARIKLFPARESLLSDIPAGDGKAANLFLQCSHITSKKYFCVSHPPTQRRGSLAGSQEGGNGGNPGFLALQ